MALTFTMSLNFLLLVAMVATNIVSLYHLSTTSSFLHSQPPTLAVPSHLLNQLHTIRATITHLTHLHPPKKTLVSSTPSDLLTFSRLSPIASSCHDHPELLYQYMNYTPFSLCPNNDTLIAESLILRGCHPLPRRRCFSRTPLNPKPSHPDSYVIWSSYPSSSSCKSFNCFHPKLGFDFSPQKFMLYKSELDLTLPQLMDIVKRANSVIRLGVDIGGGSGNFAAVMKQRNVTMITTTMNLGAPYSEANAVKGVLLLHVPLQQRLPVFDGVVDLVRCGHAVNRWIPVPVMEFLLFDVDRVLRGGGFLWIDNFFSKGDDLENVYRPLIYRLGYKIVKWATGQKMDGSGIKNGEMYLTALLQKPKSR